MMILVKYALTDGIIAGVWSGPSAEWLRPNIVENDERYGYLLSDLFQDPREVARAYRVDLSQHTLLAKRALEIVASPVPFRADGVTECTITVRPFVPCTLTLNGMPMDLTPADPTLVLTAEAPTQFYIGLVPHATHWVEQALTVEAR